MRRAVAIVSGAAALMGVFAACGVDRQLIAFEAPDASTGPTNFVPPEPDGGPDASTEPAVAMCVTSECPPGYATCPVNNGAQLPAYACGTNVMNDVQNCGACGKRCRLGSSAYHLIAGCSEGQCQAFCQTGFFDCDGLPDDGCEVDPRFDENNCGSCGNKCPDGVACLDGKCGCPPGQTLCGDKCVDLSSDDSNCGACGTACADNQPADAGALPSNMFYGCLAGQCTAPRCFHSDAYFWADCDHDLSTNGCEIDLRAPDEINCGKCGNTCDPGQKCMSTPQGGIDCQCKGGDTLCPSTGFGRPAKCADLDSDPTSCGACGYSCPQFISAAPTCTHGRCGYECNPGTADCDGRADTGCEVDLNRDPRNCGGCGISCDVAAGQPCVEGRCVTKECDAGVGPQ